MDDQPSTSSRLQSRFPLLRPHSSSQFDLETDNYEEFIESLRDNIRQPNRSSHGRPVLPVQEDVGEQQVEISLLEDGVKKGVMRIRRYDLRFMSYQTMAGGHYYDVSNYGIYSDFGSKLVCDDDISGLSIASALLRESMDYLQSNDSEDKGVKIRIHLVLLCVVFCEATKIENFKLLFSNAFKLGIQVQLKSWMLEIMNLWVELSTDLLMPDQHEEKESCNFYFPDTDNYRLDDVRRMIGATCQDVSKWVGILYGSVPLLSTIKPLVGRFKAAPLAEIHSVMIYMNNKLCGCVYGTVIVNEILIGRRVNLYDRGPDECEIIRSNGTLSLQDTNFIYGHRYIWVKLDLKEKDSNMQISNGELLWSQNDGDRFIDTRLSALIRGEHGYAIVFYTVYSRGMLATVELSLSYKDGNAATSGSDVLICGRIALGSTIFEYNTEHFRKYHMSTLFEAPCEEVTTSVRCSQGEGVGTRQGKLVKLGTPFPLSKSVVAVDVDCTLLLDVDLKTCDGKSILAGSGEWMPMENGSSEGIIEDRCGGSYILHVNLTWRQGLV